MAITLALRRTHHTSTPTTSVRQMAVPSLPVAGKPFMRPSVGMVNVLIPWIQNGFGSLGAPTRALARALGCLPCTRAMAAPATTARSGLRSCLLAKTNLGRACSAIPAWGNRLSEALYKPRHPLTQAAAKYC